MKDFAPCKPGGASLDNMPTARPTREGAIPQFKPYERWCRPEVTHVPQVQRAYRDGLAGMHANADLPQESVLALHNWWRASLLYLTLNDTDKALRGR